MEHLTTYMPWGRREVNGNMKIIKNKILSLVTDWHRSEEKEEINCQPTA
jgi:hypothetical protein